LAEHGRVFCNAFNGPLSLIQMLGRNMDLVKRFADDLLAGVGEKEGVRVKYVGDIVTDVHFAMYAFGKDDFDYWPGIPYFGMNEEMLAWAKGENDDFVSSANDELLSVYCNCDAMFHPSKGLLGLKVSGVDNVKLNGVWIENLVDFTDFGHDLCGKHDLYHFSQQSPYQIGYSMNMVLAMSVDFSRVRVKEGGIWIDGVYSATGLTFGVAAWFDSMIEYEAGALLNIFNVYAGFAIGDDDEESFLSYEDRPNKAAEACAVRIYSSNAYKVTNVFAEDGDEMLINIECIAGQVGCFGNSDKIYTNLGVVSKKESNECQRMPILDVSQSELFKMSSFDDESSPIFYCVIVLAVLLCLCVSKRIYVDYPLKKAINSNFKYKLINTRNEDNDDEYGSFVN